MKRKGNAGETTIDVDRGMFATIGNITNRDGILVTYSVKGEVRRNLKACGSIVTLHLGPSGKWQITRATKI